MVSRYSIIASGEFIDAEVSNRDFAWATIDIPGDIDLHVISVHFLTTGAGVRNVEAQILLSNVNATFASTDYIVILDDESSTSCVSKLSGPPLRFLRCSLVGMLACLPRHAWNSKSCAPTITKI